MLDGRNVLLSDGKTVAMIPARKGSERLKLKNLALVGGRPLIEHSIIAALEAKIFDQIIINSDSPVFKTIADRNGVGFYHRKPEIASSDARSDEVVEDFFNAFPKCENLFWINPIAPLQTAYEITAGVEFFERNRLDSMIAGVERQVHCMFDGKALNFSTEGLFEKTQDLPPIIEFTYSIMAWRRDPFLSDMSKRGCAIMCGHFDVFKTSPRSAFLVKTAGDLAVIDAWLSLGSEDFCLSYDASADKV